MAPVSRANAASRSGEGRRRARSATSHPASDRTMSSSYMRASVAYRSTYGLSATRRAADHAARRPPIRPAATKASGRRASPTAPDSSRTATSPSPNRSCQTWSRT
jgi:hypothetical protein